MAKALSKLRQGVARLVGGSDGVILCTATGAGSTTTAVCSALVTEYEDDFFNNDWYIRFTKIAGVAGTHTAHFTDFVSSTGTVTFNRVTGITDTGDTFELIRDINPDDIDIAVNDSIAMVEDVALQPKYDQTSLVVDNLLTDSLLETWADATTLTNWTETGTGTVDVDYILTRESTVIREGAYSAKCVCTSSGTLQLSQSIDNPMLYAGEQFTLRVYAATNTADIARVRVYDGTTNNNSSYHSGAGWLEGSSLPYLEVTGTVGASPTELTISQRVEGEGTAYFDKVEFYCGNSIFEYTVPADFRYISDITQESSVPDRFLPVTSAVQPRAWQLLSDGTTPKIIFDPKYVTLRRGKKLRITGFEKPVALVAATDTSTDINATWLKYHAASILRIPNLKDDGGAFHDRCKAIAEQNMYLVSISPKGKKVRW